MVEKIPQRLRLGELFSGPGGLALGAKLARVRYRGRTYSFTHTWASDHDPDSCETYRRNICPREPESVICDDVRKLNLGELGAIDGFAYGFPCNDFSIVGEHKGFDGRFGPLYSYGVGVLNEHNPLFFVAENVGGIASANDGLAFRTILRDLQFAGDGYAVTPHYYKFEEYGVPQVRHRVIIVGIAKRVGRVFRVPAPTTAGSPVTAREALEGRPIPPDVTGNELTAQSAIVVERLNHIRPGQNVWNSDLPEHLRLNVKAAHLSQIYKRLDPDRPSYTITGSGGGGTHGYHWAEPRALTNRERARLQTFPDDFAFVGRKESVRKQIGMAVPPRMAEVVFRAVLRTLLGLTYSYVPARWGAQQGLFEDEWRSTSRSSSVRGRPAANRKD